MSSIRVITINVCHLELFFLFVCLYLNVFLNTTDLPRPQVFSHHTNFRGQGTLICVTILTSKYFAQPPCWHILVSEKYAFIQVTRLPKIDRFSYKRKKLLILRLVVTCAATLLVESRDGLGRADAYKPSRVQFRNSFCERNTETVYSCRVFLQKTYSKRLAEGDKCEIQIILFRGPGREKVCSRCGAFAK